MLIIATSALAVLYGCISHFLRSKYPTIITVPGFYGTCIILGFNALLWGLGGITYLQVKEKPGIPLGGNIIGFLPAGLYTLCSLYRLPLFWLTIYLLNANYPIR